jgi:3-deoxy-D-manno-octulosonate 8-phosphate phosphatase (KDO 8-P phosphatase)
MQNIIEKAKQIRLMIFDIDGVLTQGHLFYGPDGHQLKVFHVHDGQGIKFLQQTGVEVAAITACKSEMTAKRLKDLGIAHAYLGTQDKLAAYEDLKQKLKLQDHQVAYLGDDLPDLPVITRVGLGMTVANASEIMRKNASFVTKAKGGKGAAREVCEIIMNAQGTYQAILDSYLKR